VNSGRHGPWSLANLISHQLVIPNTSGRKAAEMVGTMDECVLTRPVGALRDNGKEDN
jgi:hypothetical protein